MGGSKSHHYEFFGPNLGPIGIMIGLPSVCYGLVFACNAENCIDSWAGVKLLPAWPEGQKFFTWEATVVFLMWMGFQIMLHLLLPGEKVEGTVLPNGSKLTYKLTGLKNLIVTLGLVLYFGFYKDMINLSWAFDNYVPLMTVSVCFSFALSIYLYARSFLPGSLLAEEGSKTKQPVYEFFMGRELNPRVGSLDLKEFCELYPGLIGWIVLNMCMAHKQLMLYGSLSASMVLVNVFQAIYVLDALYFERAILTTMDITTDGFGFMLAFGDLAWVPFTYSLQARVLVSRSPDLSKMALIMIVLLKMIGYLMFRGSNSQKDTFRRDPSHPSVAHLKTLPTKRGTRLIISGWWGISRHINYFGDWLMGLSWCLPVAFESGILPYFYAIYFAVLLIHREARDQESCKKKYGADYAKYCKLVPYRIIPFIY